MQNLQEVIDPNQLRWKPFDIPTQPTDFVQGLRTIAHAGHSTVKHGVAVRIFFFFFKKVLHAILSYNCDYLFLLSWGLFFFFLPFYSPLHYYYPILFD